MQPLASALLEVLASQKLTRETVLGAVRAMSVCNSEEKKRCDYENKGYYDFVMWDQIWIQCTRLLEMSFVSEVTDRERYRITSEISPAQAVEAIARNAVLWNWLIAKSELSRDALVFGLLTFIADPGILYQYKLKALRILVGYVSDSAETRDVGKVMRCLTFFRVLLKWGLTLFCRVSRKTGALPWHSILE